MLGKRARICFALILLLCCGFLLASAGCDNGANSEKKTEFEIDKVYERGPLRVHVRLDKAKMTIADTVLLELEAAIEPDYEVQMPKVDKVLEHFGIVDWSNLGDRLDPNNNIVSTYRYRLEPFLSGNYDVPALTFEFYDVNEVDRKHQLSSDPIEVEVTSLLGEQRAELVIADIEDVVEMPQEPSYRRVLLIVAAGMLAALVTWFYLRRKRIDKLARIFKPAHEIAYDRLRVLVADDLISAGKVKEFYERICDILRHYIEHRFDLRAPERTTEEFLIELQWTDVLSSSDKKTLEEFLTHCDLVKFANYDPTKEQIQRTFNLVKSFIEKTRSDERKIDVTDKMVDTEEPVEAGIV